MEKENKFTPGPWTVNPIYKGDSPKICAHRLFRPDCGGSFATIENQNIKGKMLPNDETKANARLIASAPDLLKACESACELLYNQMDEAEELDHMTSGHDAETCVLCQLREAILKARGK